MGKLVQSTLAWKQTYNDDDGDDDKNNIKLIILITHKTTTKMHITPHNHAQTFQQQLEVFQPITHMNFKRKFDQTEPPALDDGSSFGRPRHKNTSSEDDPHNLEERFYRLVLLG